MNERNDTALAVDVKRSFAAKVQRGMFQPVARHLHADIAEDRLAEGIAMTFELYKKSVENGCPLNDAILVTACHLRAIDLSRRVAGSAGRAAQERRLRRAELHRGQGRASSPRCSARRHGGQSSLGFDEPGTPHPARRLASAIDLESWLLSLGAEDRLVLALRQAGHTLTEISTVTGKSITTVRVHLNELGRELAERAGVEVEVAA